MDEDISSVRELTSEIEGWLSEAEGELLYGLAKHLTGKGDIVEIGSWKGKSTVWLAKGSQKGATVKVYTIDPHTGSQEHRERWGKVWTYDVLSKNLKDAGVDSLVRPILATSEEAERSWDNRPVEFLWIDGEHAYELVHRDYLLWEPHLIDSGVIAFHDSNEDGPRRVIEKHLYKGVKFKNITRVDSITYAVKTSNLTLLEKFRNLQLLWREQFHRETRRLSALFKRFLKRIVREF